MKRTVLPVLILAAAAVALGLWRPWSKPQDPNTIRISGNVELTQVDIAFQTSGRLTELLVDEGAPVRKGAVVARLDQDQLRRQRQRDEAGVKAAASAIEQLRTAIAWQRETLARELELRRAEWNQAEARLRELKAGSRQQEIRQAEATVTELRDQHEQAHKDWERAQALYAREDISTAQHDQARTRFRVTAASLRRGEEQLALLREGARQEQIDAARAQLDRARAAIRLAEASRIDIQRREQEVEARQAEWERAQAQLAITDSLLSDTTVTSPVDGIVLVKAVEPGQVLAAGATVVTIGDLSRPWVRGYITEQQLGRVKPGDTAEVMTDSYPGRTYRGRISFIASEAEFTPKQIQTAEERVKLVYRIKINVDNPAHELKSNMPVEVVLHLSRQ